MGGDDESVGQWSTYEKKTQQEQQQMQLEIQAQRSKSQQKPAISRTCVHMLFISYSGLAFISAILLGVGQLIGFKYKELPTTLDQVLRYFISIFLLVMSGLSALSELEVCPCLVGRLLTLWATRGIIYMFMAFLSIYQLEMHAAPKTDNEVQFIRCMSYIFGGIGVGYTVMGLICFKSILDRIRLDYHSRKHGYKTSEKPIETPSDLTFGSSEEIV